MTVTCLGCTWSGPAEKCTPALSVYHDLRCPECGTTNLDTSAIIAADPSYGYGDDNTLRLPPREAING